MESEVLFVASMARSRFTLSALLLCGIAASPALGASLGGDVLDPSGASVGDAAVELVGRAGVERTRTAADGSFIFAAIPPGRYEVRVSAPGFGTNAQTVELRETAVELTFQLQLEEQKQELDVAAEADAGPPNPAANADRIELTGDDLQKLPAMDGDVIATLQSFLDGDSFGSDGGGLVVDGIETSDLGVSPSAIQEIQINKDPYSAEYSRPGRSRIEVITKKGAQELHGQLNLRARDYRLDARNAFASERPEQSRRAVEGHVVGPLSGGGRHSFVLSGEHDQDRQAALIFATTPDGIVRQAALAPEVETEASARWDYHPSPERAFSLRYEYERESEKNSGVGGFTLPEGASDRRGADHGVYWSYRKIFGASSLLEWSGRVGRETESERSRSEARRLVVQDAFTAGGAQVDSSGEEFYGEGSAVFSTQRGRHYLRTGLMLRELGRQTFTDRANFGGTFEFSSLADYEAGRPFAFTIREGDPRLSFWDMEAAVFAQDNIRLGPRSTLAVGVRYDRQNYGGDPDNVAPRASFAHGLGREGRTTIRVGAGVFYDNIHGGAYADLLRFGGDVQIRELLLRNPSYPDPLVGAGSEESLPSNRVRWSAGLSTPYVGQYSATVERRLSKETVLSVSWTRRVGVGLLRSLDLNAPLAGVGRPDPELGIVRQLGSSARLESQEIQTQLRGNLGEFFQGTLRYAWGRAYNDVGDDEELPANSLDLSREWGPAAFDRRHSFDALGAFEVKNWFELGVVLEMESAPPYTLITGDDDNGDGVAKDRPAGIGRNTERGAGAVELDMRLSRGFDMPGIRAGEPTRLTLTLDAFNVLNTVNFGDFVGNMRSPLFGQATSAGSARRLQAGLRWSF